MVKNTAIGVDKEETTAKINQIKKSDSQNIKVDFHDISGNNEFINDKIFVSEYLKETSGPDFLDKLNYESRMNWLDSALKIIQKSNFSFGDLFRSRAAELPQKALFRYYRHGRLREITYSQAENYVNEITTAFYSIAEEPKVAIIAENSPETAACDLACLVNGIFVTPLSHGFGPEIYAGIFSELEINIAVTDSPARYRMLAKLRAESSSDFSVIFTDPEIKPVDSRDSYLNEIAKRLTKNEIDEIISNLPEKDIREVCTVMFTSGSTGKPKGISFSNYNITSKRFCRGAAVPFLGHDELMVSYLPLYHTFGRFLEMTGSVYWRGTYVFTGNTSRETLLEMIKKFEPSIFISIPLRWQQIFDKAAELTEKMPSRPQEEVLREVTGENLKWGLSAAGYLDPRTFRYFNNNGIMLCSGFGMTEATGGITMTPPGEYIENSVGKPLPGVNCELSSDGELIISGHYITQYLEDTGSGDIIDFPGENGYKVHTGDIFRKQENGHYEIIDRIKDIYKNNRGQTVAPKRVENKFIGVPGIKSVFLVGDGKPYNVLFIVPDSKDEIFANMSREELDSYYKRIIFKANSELMPFERVVNYIELERDFSAEKKELTPKKSFNRKIITENFAEIIQKIYDRNELSFKFGDFELRINRWVIRDLGILESELVRKENSLENTRNGKRLYVDYQNGKLRLGSLEYSVERENIELGRIIRQPLLWSGNPELIDFAPVKESYDTYFSRISTFAMPLELEFEIEKDIFPKIKNSDLRRFNELISKIYFSSEPHDALFEEIEPILLRAEPELKELIRKRLQALAYHNNEDVRCTAYRILLLDDPSPDYSKAFPAFLYSGKTFLNEKSINEIATRGFEKRQLEMLRKRLYSYRTRVEIPENENTVAQFETLFKLLFDFTIKNPEFYPSVRYEFISWILYDKNKSISELADRCFDKLYHRYEKQLREEITEFGEEFWKKKLVFDDRLNSSEIAAIKNAYVNTALFRQSVMLAFGENDFDITKVSDGGIWFSRLESSSELMHFRVDINMQGGKKYSLHSYINLTENLDRLQKTVMMHVRISGYPYGTKLLPKLGAFRRDLKAWTFAYSGELSAWDKLREFDSKITAVKIIDKKHSLRKIFVQSISAFFKAWKYSEYSIVPGIISPENVLVPELDYKTEATISNIFRWKYYENPGDLFNPVFKNFYLKTTMHYNWLRGRISQQWIFESMMEAFGREETYEKIDGLLNSDFIEYPELKDSARDFLEEIRETPYIPLQLETAIMRFFDWYAGHPGSTAESLAQSADDIYNLFNIGSMDDIFRYYYYLYTYFRNAGKQFRSGLENFITGIITGKEEPGPRLSEHPRLAELHSLLENSYEKITFNRMIYPNLKISEKAELTATGSGTRRHSSLVSYIRDNSGEVFTIREPLSASEVGMLYRIFFIEKFPRQITEKDNYLVLADSREIITGGLCYRVLNEEVVHLDGIVLNRSIRGRGLGSGLLGDFIPRMRSAGFKLIKTPNVFREFYLSKGFRISDTWGTAVMPLDDIFDKKIVGDYCAI
jgi:long-chain acyl-CoA synthetase